MTKVAVQVWLSVTAVHRNQYPVFHELNHISVSCSLITQQHPVPTNQNQINLHTQSQFTAHQFFLQKMIFHLALLATAAAAPMPQVECLEIYLIMN